MTVPKHETYKNGYYKVVIETDPKPNSTGPYCKVYGVPGLSTVTPEKAEELADWLLETGWEECE